MNFGSQQSPHNYCLFTKGEEKVFVSHVVYDDDVLNTGPNEAFITKFKNYLNQTFTIKDHGDASYFIGIELLKTKKGFYVNQRKYVLDIWSEAGLTDI